MVMVVVRVVVVIVIVVMVMVMMVIVMVVVVTTVGMLLVMVTMVMVMNPSFTFFPVLKTFLSAQPQKSPWLQPGCLGTQARVWGKSQLRKGLMLEP